jgi:hypothetical protein
VVEIAMQEFEAGGGVDQFWRRGVMTSKNWAIVAASSVGNP